MTDPRKPPRKERRVWTRAKRPELPPTAYTRESGGARRAHSRRINALVKAARKRNR